MRVAMNVILRDLIQTGEGDFALRTGVAIPSGDGAVQIVRPGPPGSDWAFSSDYTALPAVSPASGIGPTVNGIATDVVTLLYEDRRLDFSGVTPQIADDGSTMTFPDGFAIDDDAAGIKEGDLIRFANGAMQEVTAVAGQRITFDDAAASQLNHRDAPQGTVMALKGGADQFPALSVSRVLMITFYVKVPETGLPQLIRRVNYGPERVVAVGIENLQFSWDLVNGVDNPTNVETFAAGSEGQIRKANVFLSARSSAPNGQPTRGSLTTEVSLRSMAFVSRYDLAP